MIHHPNLETYLVETLGLIFTSAFDFFVQKIIDGPVDKANYNKLHEQAAKKTITFISKELLSKDQIYLAHKVDQNKIMVAINQANKEFQAETLDEVFDNINKTILELRVVKAKSGEYDQIISLSKKIYVNYLIDNLGSEHAILAQILLDNQNQIKEEIIKTIQSKKFKLLSPGSKIKHKSYFSIINQLPSRDTEFTGRHEYIDRLLKLYEDKKTKIAITGFGGFGKTSLAIEFAHRIKKDFPDGIIFLNLLGAGDLLEHPSLQKYDHQELTQKNILKDILLSLDFIGQIPEELSELKGLYRHLLRDKKVLIILDNTLNNEQIEGIECLNNNFLLVTSRNHIYLRGYEEVELLKFPIDDSYQYIKKILKRKFNRSEAKNLAEVCEGMPLLITLACSYLNLKPLTSVESYIQKFNLNDLDPINACIESSISLLNTKEQLVLFSLPYSANLTRKKEAGNYADTDRYVFEILILFDYVDKYGLEDLISQTTELIANPGMYSVKDYRMIESKNLKNPLLLAYQQYLYNMHHQSTKNIETWVVLIRDRNNRIGNQYDFYLDHFNQLYNLSLIIQNNIMIDSINYGHLYLGLHDVIFKYLLNQELSNIFPILQEYFFSLMVSDFYNNYKI